MDEIPEWMAPAGDSAFRDLIGYYPRVWRENYVEMLLKLEERHRNRSGIAHGGVVATMVDVAGGFAGCFCPHPGRVRRASTLSLTTQFVGPARIGRTLIATGRTKPGGKSIYFATIEIVDDEGKTVATGEAVYKYRPGSETLEGVAR